MMTYDMPLATEYSYPVPIPQSYLQNFVQTVDFPVPQTIQPVIVPAPVGVPLPQPYGVPIDRPVPFPYFQPVPYPVDRPCAVPMPVGVPVPQPYAVPQPFVVREQVGVPVPVPVPVQVPQQNYYPPPVVQQVERIIEEPIRIKRCRRRRRRYRSCTPSPPPPPLAPIIITVPIQAPAPVQPAYQVTEYVQDIYPPAQVFTEQVPVGYVAQNNIVQESAPIVRQQTSLNCQPGVVIPTGSSSSIHQRLPTGQIIQRPLSVGGPARVQTVVLPASNSANVINPRSVQTRIIG